MWEPTPAEIRLFRRLSQLALELEAGILTEKQAEILTTFLHRMKQVVDAAAESETIDERQEIFLRAESSMNQPSALEITNVVTLYGSGLFDVSSDGK